MWDTHPGEVGYRRHPDGTSGAASGGNLLTPGVIVAPASLNAQINDDGGMIMGDDQDPSGSTPLPLVVPSGTATPQQARRQAITWIKNNRKTISNDNNKLYIAPRNITVHGIDIQQKNGFIRLYTVDGHGDFLENLRKTGENQYEAGGDSPTAVFYLLGLAANHGVAVQDLGEGTLTATLQDGTVVTSHIVGTTSILTIKRPGEPQVTVRIVTSLQQLAQEIRDAGLHNAAKNNRTIAVGRDSNGQLFAGASNGGFDKGMRDAADRLRIKRVPNHGGNHAEENLMAAVPDLTQVGTFKRFPCGPDEHDCFGQLQKKKITITNPH